MNIRLFFILIMSVVLVLPISCGKIESETADSGEHKHDHSGDISILEIEHGRLELIGIKTEKLKYKIVSQNINATAEIEFNVDKLFHIGPRIKGRVVKIFADFGDEVMKGQELAALNSIELGEARSLFLKAKVRLEVAQANYERETRLWEKKISSEKEMLNAKGKYFVAKVDFEAVENKLHLLGLSEDDVKSTISQLHTLEHFPIHSPYKGTVINKHITLGEMTNPEETLFTIANLDILWIILHIYEKDLTRVDLGQKVDVYVSAYPEEEFKGYITYISNVVEEETRTVKVRVEIDNSMRKLKPGMFATAKIITGEPAKRLTVPLSSLQRLEGKSVVFVVRGDSLFECCTVTTGREYGTDIEVLDGIKEGETVVTEGAFYLKSELLKETIKDDHAH